MACVNKLLADCFGSFALLTPSDAPIASLYLIAVKRAGKLIAFKYGRTSDLRGRMMRHRLGFNRKGLEICLIHYAEIVPASLPKAEQRLRNMIRDLEIPKYHDGYSRELIQVRDGDLVKLIDCYQRIADKFGAAIVKSIPPSPTKRFPSPEQISLLEPAQAKALLSQFREQYQLAREAEQRAEQRYHACLLAMGDP